MIWSAELANGNTVSEYTNGVYTNFLNLKFTEVKSLSLVYVQTSNVVFNSADGTLYFPNLDLRKLSNFTNDNKLILEFDETIQNFKLSSGSLKVLNSLVYSEAKNSQVIAKLTDDCKFWVNNLSIFTGIEHEGEMIQFTNKFDKLIHYKQGFTDFIGNNLNDPHTRIDTVSNYIIGYENKYNIKDNTLNVKCLINVDTIRQTINLEVYVTSTQKFISNLCIFINNELTKIPVSFSENETAKFEKVLAIY